MDNSGNWARTQKLSANDRAEDDAFGWDVAISGNYAVVGTFVEDEDQNGANTMSDAGSVYIFERNGSGVWQQVQKVVASDRATGDGFGYSVAISGNYLIVGAQSEDHNAIGSAPLTDAGSAYIFERNGNGVWAQVKKIVASDRGAGDNFGGDVSISGTIAVVGALYEDQNATGGNTLSNSGSAYVFERSSGVWNQVAKVVASDRDVDDLFGTSVAVSNGYILIGARVEDHDEMGTTAMSNTGSAYFFEKKGGVWTQVQKVVSGNRENYGIFGIVSISGNYALVGAYSESRDVNGSNPVSQAGAAYLFERDANSGVWNRIAKIVAGHRGIENHFGSDVAISGNYMISGSPYDYLNEQGKDSTYSCGASYIFKNCKPTSSYISPISCAPYFSPSGKSHMSTSIFNDTINNVNGCDSIITVDLTVLSNDTGVVQNAEVLSSNDGTGDHQWVDCGNGYGKIDGATNKTFTPTKNGTYAVVVCHGNCCDTSACYTVNTLSMQSIAFANTFRILPNPVLDIFELKDETGAIINGFKILDAGGRLLYNNSDCNSSSIQVDMSAFESGMFMIEISSIRGIYTLKFLKE